VLQIGKADFTVAQKGVSDVLNSNLDQQEVAAVESYPQVQSAVGVLVAGVNFNGNPFFLELGIPPEQLAPFGVQILAGRAYAADATDEIILGFRTAESLHKTIGDQVTIDSITFNIVGIYSVGNAFADAASMVPLLWLQGRQRLAGYVTLLFVKTKPGTDVPALAAQIQKDHPELAAVQTASQFGLIDRNLSLISAADVGVSVLALFMGAVGVMNTTLMSVFERTREFGVLRAVGWSRGRIVIMVMGEALLIALAGAFVGTAMGFAAVQVIKQLPNVLGFFNPVYPASVFGQALGVAVGMAFFGVIYPAARAALLQPLEALRHE
jgi:putative ABC transport system permease protein